MLIVGRQQHLTALDNNLRQINKKDILNPQVSGLSIIGEDCFIEKVLADCFSFLVSFQTVV